MPDNTQKITMKGVKLALILAICAGFGYLYGLLIRNITNFISINAVWVYLILAIPIFLPIFEYIRSESGLRPKFMLLLKELTLSFISALIAILVLSRFWQAGDIVNEIILAAAGLVMVIAINFLVDKVLVKYLIKKSSKK